MTVGYIIYEFYLGMARIIRFFIEGAMNLTGLTRCKCSREVGDRGETRKPQCSCLSSR